MSDMDYKAIIKTRIANLESLEQRYERLDKESSQSFYRKIMNIQEEIGVLQEILEGRSDIYQWEECYRSDVLESK